MADTDARPSNPDRTQTAKSGGPRARRPTLVSLRLKDPKDRVPTWKIASSYNLHDDPIYQPVSADSDAEDQEAEAQEAAGIAFSAEAELTIDLDERKGSIGAASVRRRRRSTVWSAKPPNIVTWEGIDDPENPKNWPMKKKWTATVIVSLFTFMSPVASSMIAPALDVMARELKVQSNFETQLMLSIFILAYAVGPLMFGPLSEIFGRVRVLQATNLFYLVWNLACGFAQTGGQMLAFRFLAGLGGSAPSAIGGGVLGDCWRADQRGKAVAAYSLAPLIGPSIGPIAGGYIGENISWRWVFWVSSIADACIQLFGIFFLQETYAPELLRRKAKKLRYETGNLELRTEYEDPETPLASRLRVTLVRPFRLLLTQPIIQILACYMAFLYGLTYLIYATLPALWQNRYHESMGVSGLNYISLSVGYALGTQVIAPINDRVYRRLKAKNDGHGRPEFRCPVMVPAAVFVIIGIFWYGWSAQARLHWIMPNLGMVFFSVGADMGFQCLTAYLVDTYSRYAASGLAAATFLRSMAGFGFPLFAPALFNSLGYGWGNSVLGFVAMGLGLPAPFLLWKYGPMLRARSQYAAGGK